MTTLSVLLGVDLHMAGDDTPEQAKQAGAEAKKASQAAAAEAAKKAKQQEEEPMEVDPNVTKVSPLYEVSFFV